MLFISHSIVFCDKLNLEPNYKIPCLHLYVNSLPSHASKNVYMLI